MLELVMNKQHSGLQSYYSQPLFREVFSGRMHENPETYGAKIR